MTRILLAAVSLISSAALAQQKPEPRKWRIKGQFSEACTCSVPCSCNFGESPSPHKFCHAMWSYWVKEGNWDRVQLRDRKIGGIDGPGGVMGLLDSRATSDERVAMENIWHMLSGRLFCLIRLWPFKAAGDPPGSGRPVRQSSVIRVRYAGRQFIGFQYVPIRQLITEMGMSLGFGDKGGFEASYIRGRDTTRPITVTNNVSWPVSVTIKAKASSLRYNDEFNHLDYQGTNANQGDFDIADSDAGALPMDSSNKR